MRTGLPFDALHDAISSAVMRDLPEISYWQRNWLEYKKLSKEEQSKWLATDGKGPGEYKTRRPMSDEVEIVMFPQTWGSTALGYGGMGGAAMTSAYTVIVSYHDTSCVYFGSGRLAYKVTGKDQTPKGRDAFRIDMHSHNMTPVSSAGKYK